MADLGSSLPPPPAVGLPVTPSSPRPRDPAGWLRFGLGLALAAAAVAGVGAAWPDDDPSGAVAAQGATTTLMTKEAAEAFTPPPGVVEIPGSGGVPVPVPAGPGADGADLFGGGPSAAVGEVLAAAGRPSQLLELTIYPSYLFVAYRDPANPGNIDERQWRGEVGEASANLIDDRVDADTEPDLFTVDELGPALELLPSLVADAVGRYDIPTEVTHVIIDRFLPFDERVLVRVYASPSDGRSGGGYVTYTTDGAFQKVCC